MIPRRFAMAVAAVLLPAAAQDAHAQDGFLFGRPAAQLTVRTGPVLHRAQSDLFDFFTSELTLDRSDFRAPGVGAELGLAVHPRVDVTIGLAVAQTRTHSEFRDWVDQDDQPIEQTTTLRTMPISLSARLYPLSRGRAVSSLAWLPARTTPYIGGGVDVTAFRLQQQGDFVAEDASIHQALYESRGSALTAHVRAGVDQWLTPRLGLNVDARYAYGSARPDDDFLRWDALDLSGLQAGVGLTFRW